MLDLSTKDSTWEPSFELLLFQYGGKDGSQLPKIVRMEGMPGRLGKQCFQYNCIYLNWISVRVRVRVVCVDLCTFTFPQNKIVLNRVDLKAQPGHTGDTSAVKLSMGFSDS